MSNDENIFCFKIKYKYNSFDSISLAFRQHFEESLKNYRNKMTKDASVDVPLDVVANLIHDIKLR